MREFWRKIRIPLLKCLIFVINILVMCGTIFLFANFMIIAIEILIALFIFFNIRMFILKKKKKDPYIDVEYYECESDCFEDEDKEISE